MERGHVSLRSYAYFFEFSEFLLVSQCFFVGNVLLSSMSFASFFVADLCSDGCALLLLSESDCASPSVDAGLALFDQPQCCADCTGEGNPSGMLFAASIPLV